jgi:hypothetical protein
MMRASVTAVLARPVVVPVIVVVVRAVWGWQRPEWRSVRLIRAPPRWRRWVIWTHNGRHWMRRWWWLRRPRWGRRTYTVVVITVSNRVSISVGWRRPYPLGFYHGSKHQDAHNRQEQDLRVTHVLMHSDTSVRARAQCSAGARPCPSIQAIVYTRDQPSLLCNSVSTRCTCHTKTSMSDSCHSSSVL